MEEPLIAILLTGASFIILPLKHGICRHGYADDIYLYIHFSPTVTGSLGTAWSLHSWYQLPDVP